MADKKMKAFLQPAFLICTAVLLIACVGKQALIADFIKRLTKTPIDLRKSFDGIDREKLGSFVVVNESKIDNKDVVESLGTKDYIQWILKDTEAGEKSATRYCQLFITYYGMPDKVPHVPDECYIGSGYDQVDARYELLNIDGKEDPIKMRLLVFESANKDVFISEPRFSRMYFFKVNKDYACTRTGVREILGKNIFGKHSFFSKVEWEFFGNALGARVRPGDEQNLAASEKLISKLLPVLENEHWPSPDELEGEAKTETKTTDEQIIENE